MSSVCMETSGEYLVSAWTAQYVSVISHQTSIYMYMYLFINPSISLASQPLDVCETIHRPNYLFIHSSTHPSIRPTIHPSNHPFIYSFIHPRNHLFTDLSIHPFIYPSNSHFRPGSSKDIILGFQSLVHFLHHDVNEYKTELQQSLFYPLFVYSYLLLVSLNEGESGMKTCE